MTYLLSLDQGTSSSRSIVFNRCGEIVSLAQAPLPQIYPQPGWVEHDPWAIWRTQLDTARQALAQAGIGAGDIEALGITNQRETTVVWNRRTGEPIHNALVWQDRRTEPACAQLREQGLEPHIHATTGLRIDPYFSGTKIQWLLDHIPGARQQAERGELAFGTVDTWLLWNLTGGAVHATDVSNASRTLLFDIRRQQWDEALMHQLRIPAAMLPDVRPSAFDYGHTQAALLGAPVRIGALVGDQQSALFGQGCFEPGLVKNTYGTGCFMLMNTGRRQTLSSHGLLCTCGAQTDTDPVYALEGSVFAGGSVVQWLRDGLRAFEHSHEVEALAASVPDAGGALIVPAFTGLGAPYWQPQARGTITGLSRGTTLAHLARAALDSIALQSAALLQAMNRDAQARGAPAVTELRVDGGASANNLLMQIQADVLGIPVVRPAVVETTALGAAYLAGLSAGVYADLADLARLQRVERRFEPAISAQAAADRMCEWEHAVRQTLAP